LFDSSRSTVIWWSEIAIMWPGSAKPTSSDPVDLKDAVDW